MLAGCTISPSVSTPHTAYPDASTPPGFDEFNGGIIADVQIHGRWYNVVTPNLEAKIQKWQGNRNGFVRVLYHGSALTAIDKAIVFLYDIH